MYIYNLFHVTSVTSYLVILLVLMHILFNIQSIFVYFALGSICILIYHKIVCRKSLVNRNSFRSFYEKIVKNALKTPKDALKM